MPTCFECVRFMSLFMPALLLVGLMVSIRGILVLGLARLLVSLSVELAEENQERHIHRRHPHIPIRTCIQHASTHAQSHVSARPRTRAGRGVRRRQRRMKRRGRAGTGRAAGGLAGRLAEHKGMPYKEDGADVSLTALVKCQREGALHRRTHTGKLTLDAHIGREGGRREGGEKGGRGEGTSIARGRMK